MNATLRIALHVLLTASVIVPSLSAQVTDTLPCTLDGFYVEQSLDSAIKDLRSVNSALSVFMERTDGEQPCMFIVSCVATISDERIMSVWGMVDGVPWVIDTVVQTDGDVRLASAEGDWLQFLSDGQMIAQRKARRTGRRYVRVARDLEQMNQYVRSLTLAGTYKRDGGSSCTFTSDGRFVVDGDTLLYRVRYEANDGKYDVLEVTHRFNQHEPVLYEIKRHGAEVILQPVVRDEESYEHDSTRRRIRLLPATGKR
jgi:hypothetical protein